MKKIYILFVSLAIIGLLVISCNEDSPTNSNDQPGGAQSSGSMGSTIVFPERPNIGPEESNWSDSSLQSSSSGLEVRDLNEVTPNDLVETIIGSGSNAPDVSNITFNGTNIAGGIFSGGTGIIGFESGIILSTGNCASVVGPNTSDGITTNNNLPGDEDLNQLIPGFTTYDASTLEFDFECPELQVISFQYVFSSDEYNEYVNSNFNDIFAIFLNGMNIALIPNTTMPVSINNLNCGNPFDPPNGSHCDLFINNDLSDGGGSINTEMDGLTVVLTATAAVNPGINHIKFVIADAGDRVLDSNILIKSESFICNRRPIAKCQNVYISADANCQATVTAEQVDNGSFDPDGDPITLTLSPSGPYPLGSTQVELTVTDDKGLFDQCTAKITVIDSTPPVVSCSVTPLEKDDLDDDKYDIFDEELVVNFSAMDNCDSVWVSAVIDIGCKKVVVQNGQIIEIECGDDDCEAEFDEGVLEIESNTAVLIVKATDVAGNTTICTINLCKEDDN